MKKEFLKKVACVVLSASMIVQGAAPVMCAGDEAFAGDSAEVLSEDAGAAEQAGEAAKLTGAQQTADEQTAGAQQTADEQAAGAQTADAKAGSKAADAGSFEPGYEPGFFTDYDAVAKIVASDEFSARIAADSATPSGSSSDTPATGEIRGGDKYTFWGYKIDENGKSHKYDYSVAVYWYSGYSYNGKAIKPLTMVFDVTDTNQLSTSNLLDEGKHYTTICSNNKNASEKATLRIKGKGKFSHVDTAAKSSWPTLYFTINKIAMTADSITIPDYGVQFKDGKVQLAKPSFMYIGSNKMPASDYALTFVDQSKSGAYEKKGDWTVRVSAGKSGNVTGARNVIMTVSDKLPARKLKVKYQKKQGHTGAALKPSVEVSYKKETLRAGTDYTVSYANNIYKGTGLIIISGKGDYYGVNVKTFKIK